MHRALCAFGGNAMLKNRNWKADEMEMAIQTIIAIENNKYNPTLELAMKISEYFGLTANDIFQKHN